MRTYTDTPATRFHREFPDILLRLHSERIPPGQSRVITREIRSAAEVENLFCAFRATNQRIFVGSGTPNARPMRIAELIARLSEIPEHDRVRFSPSHYVEGGAPPEVQVPAYCVGQDEFLLLDGNHRATALALSGRPFKLQLKVLEAPVDRKFLFDLKFWDGGLRRFSRRLQGDRMRLSHLESQIS